MLSKMEISRALDATLQVESVLTISRHSIDQLTEDLCGTGYVSVAGDLKRVLDLARTRLEEVSEFLSGIEDGLRGDIDA